MTSPGPIYRRWTVFPWGHAARCLALTALIAWPFRASAGDRFLLTPVFQLETVYTDNLFTTTVDTEEDILTSVTPGWMLAWEAPTAGLSISYLPSFVHYQRFSEYDTWRHAADLSAHFAPDRHTLVSLKDNFKITEDPSTSSSGRKEGGTTGTEDAASTYRPEVERKRRSRDLYLTNVTGLSLTHEFSRRLSCEATYDIDVQRNEDPTMRNHVSHQPATEWRYWVVPRQLEMTAGAAYLSKDVSDAIGDPGYLEERLSPEMAVVWHIIPDRCQLGGGVAYIRGVFTDNAVTSVPATGSQTMAEDNWYESLRASWSFAYTTERFDVTADGFLERGLTYDNDGQSDPSDDYRTLNTRLRLGRPFTRHLVLFVGFAHDMTRFDGNEKGESKDYVVYEPSLGVEYRLTEELPLSLNVGYLIRERKAGDPERGFTFNGQLGSWQFARHGTISFRASSGYTQDQLGPERLGFGVHYEATLHADYVFTRELSAQADMGYRRERYIDNKDTGGEFRDDREKSVDVALVYHPLDWLTLQMGYGWHDVSATDKQDDYTENRVTLKATMSPSRPWRMKQ